VDYLLGVDAGNTKTVALVARVDGTVAGWGRAGQGDIYGAPSVEHAVGEVEAAVQGALDRAGIGADRLLAGGFTMAGADWPEDYELLYRAMAARGWGRTIVIANDALGALRAGSRDGTGVSVVCGTGAAVGGRAADGRVWHSSFWQWPQGAYDLGEQALGAVYRAELGIAPPTGLTRAVLDFFRQHSVEALLHLLTAREGRGGKGEYAQSAAMRRVGGLARVLLDEADRGDPVARCIAREHGLALGDYGVVAARRVGLEGRAFTLVLAGGVLRHPSSVLAEAIVERVRSTSPRASPVKSRFEPVVGALFLGFDAAGLAVDDRLLSRLVPTLPPAAYFET
jgi:N-acetylglucosamine kinase-like BadF-type ATPase